ncbi:hypothetical protein [Phocaeicola barnesiae]|uniref:hypothetical protein n=1 Tax=Phocaeicola barnesiae TaxID=376804 RepID=UPI0025A3C11D|nr:hypothetical protein [Phocaeicola barnesiae]MDM8253342.1 hypothetical protein [Phocaeicola barnesiae]
MIFPRIVCTVQSATVTTYIVFEKVTAGTGYFCIFHFGHLQRMSVVYEGFS